MKNRIFISLLFMMAVTLAFAAKDNNVSVNELPSQARFFIRTEFPESQILSVITLEKGKVYEVKTHDQSTLTFDEKGNWLSLECPKVGVPSFVIPQKIQTALKKNCGTHTKVTQLKKISRGRFDVELSNGFGLRFDKKLEIVDVRDRALMVQSK